MKLIPILLAAVLLSLATSPAQTDADDPRVVRVFILAGQSNMVGSDAHTDEIDRFPEFVGVGPPQDDVRYRFMHGPEEPGNGSLEWVSLRPDPRGFFGPELTFARRVNRSVKAPLALIKSAWGGTTLAHDWNPDEPSDKRLYERLIRMVREALGDLDRRRVRHRLEGVLWHQGENDMLDSDLRDGYGERLTAFIARVRKDLVRPELPWFVGEISDKGIWGLDHRMPMQTLRRQQRAVADADPNVHFVATSHLAFAVTNDGPHYHFGTEGQLQHGEAYADAYLRTLGIATPIHRDGYERLPIRAGQTVRVFVLAGQRTAEGDGAYAAELARLGKSSALRKPRAKVPFRFRLGGGAFTSPDWVPLGPTGYLGTFGPELSLGRALDEALRDPIVLIKTTNGAAMLEDWCPDSETPSRPQYADALAFIRDGLADLEKRGFAPRLDAVFWIPGEHDAYWGPFRQRYAERLTELLGALRRDLKQPDLDVVAAELPLGLVWEKARLVELNDAVRRVAADDPHLTIAATADLDVPEGRPTPGTAGTVELGRRLARRYLEIERARR